MIWEPGPWHRLGGCKQLQLFVDGAGKVFFVVVR